MKKYTPALYVVLVIWAICGLGIYGVQAWYFADRSTWLLVVPTGVVGIALGMELWRRLRPFHTTRLSRMGAPLIVLLVPSFMSAAVALGVPALTLRLLGPDTQIAATIFRKEHGSRRCRRQIYLAEYWPSRLCVSAREYESLQQNSDVLLNVRNSVFGTFVFSIEPN